MAGSKRRAHYRPDIDGLRAVAILSVILFHARVPFVTGGFVGVDVFFVLSGFLISSIVYRQIKEGTFTFRSFYERRAKRILPALFAVLGLSYLLASLLLTPREIRSFAGQTIATIGGASNIFFWRSSGYFDARTELKPLLMAWSLGVEEQFYLLFPLLLIILFRKTRRALLPVLLVLSVFSFLFSIYQTAKYPQTAFYMLPSRWWELGTGTLLGVYLSDHGESATVIRRLRGAREVLSIFGLITLAGSIFLFTRTTPFPGAAAAPPVLATACLILAEGSWINRQVLSFRPMAWIGLVSYSWYLWHWPLLSFAKISTGGDLPGISAFVICVLALALAAGTYSLVEQPFRKVTSHPRLLWKYAALSVAMSVPSLIILADHGWPSRYPKADAIEAMARPPIDNPCLLLDQYVAVPNGPPCLPVAGNTLPVLAIMGDSHAGSLANYLTTEAHNQGWTTAQYTKVSCTPTGLVGVHSTATPSLAEECPTFFSAADEAIAENPAIKTVLLTGLWTDWVDSNFPERHYNPPGRDISQPIPEDASYQNLRTGLDAVVKLLVKHGKRVVLADDVPEVPFDPLLRSLTDNIPSRRLLSRLVGHSTSTGDSFSHVTDDKEKRIAQLLRDVAAADNAEYIDLSAPLCDGQECRLQSNGKLLYYDNGHLTVEGARYVLRDASIFSH